MARGPEWNVTAYAPTIRYRASASESARNRSMKSLLTGVPSLELPELEAQLPGQLDPLVGGHARPEFTVDPVGLGSECRLLNGHDARRTSHARTIARASRDQLFFVFATTGGPTSFSAGGTVSR